MSKNKPKTKEQLLREYYEAFAAEHDEFFEKSWKVVEETVLEWENSDNQEHSSIS
jgi:uncharacterized protein YchJ